MHTRDVSGPVILEREWELSELADAARDAAVGDGGLVLILGEAGIGKSSLVQAVRGVLPAEGRLLVGRCDDLSTPRTLGPFRDLVGRVGTDLARALREGDRDAVLAALRAELDWAGHPTVLAVEDVHWADEATLDVLRYLARRIAELPAVLVLTYRDDELTRRHPLQRLLGQASDSGRVRRLPLRRLSEQAVRRLSAASRVDPHRVFALTSGNPFFVTEVLAAGDGDRVPSTIVDAVLGRVRRLDAATQDALEQLAAVPSTVEGWLVDALVPGGLAALAAAEERGLRWLSRMHWWTGDRTAAEHAAAEAIAVLEPAGDRRLLALALSNQSQLDMLANRATDCIRVGERAIALAREADDAAILSHALNNVGVARWRLGDQAGWALLEEGLRIALSAGEIEHACRSYVNVIWHQLDALQLDAAERNLADGIGLAERSDHLSYLGYLQVELGMLKLARAAWDDAVRAVRRGLSDIPHHQCPALTVLGRVRVRRGEPGGDELLKRAWELAVELQELQRTGPVAAARAEAAWLAGDHAAVRAAAGPVHEDARRLGHLPLQAELGYWLTRAGHTVTPLASEHPYALQAAGRWREAAAAWQAVGCPYEHAAALASSPDPQDRLAALAELDALGAAPLARLVRAGLRELGVTHVPRGPVGATRENPAGLTGRQVEVLRLLGEGCTNAEIADRLVISTRTVDSHVAAVLAKLGVATRRDAATRAADLGVLDAEVR